LNNKIVKQNPTKLISYEKNPTTTFIQLLITENFKNKITNTMQEKTQKRKKNLTLM
jgi:hypothetical protein